jgi:ferrous iron transport protein B
MMGLYLMGLFMALLVSYVAKFFIRIKERSFFILELPTYRPPRVKNIATAMTNKARIFVTEAGKIIMVISLILWSLSYFGPPSRMAIVDQKYEQIRKSSTKSEDQIKVDYNEEKLENSYAGVLGKAIEPGIKPLGYDWRIGIALITSFAAREVFVGTMATLFSVGDSDEGTLLRDKMRAAKKDDGTPLFTVATGVSLMVFYLFAMQCMSTLAIVKRETKSWKWPVIQLIYMTAIAYIMSFIFFQLLK